MTYCYVGRLRKEKQVVTLHILLCGHIAHIVMVAGYVRKIRWSHCTEIDACNTEEEAEEDISAG